MLLTLFLFSFSLKVLSSCENACSDWSVYILWYVTRQSLGDQKCSAGEFSFIVPYLQLQSPLSYMIFFPGLSLGFHDLKVQV